MQQSWVTTWQVEGGETSVTMSNGGLLTHKQSGLPAKQEVSQHENIQAATESLPVRLLG